MNGLDILTLGTICFGVIALLLLIGLIWALMILFPARKSWKDYEDHFEE